MLKKYNIIAITLLGLWHSTVLAEQKLDDDAMVLYSLGYKLGEDINGQQLEFREDMVLQGIKDAIGGNEPVFGKDLQRQAMASIKAQRAEKNLQIAEVFLAQNGNRPEVTTLSSGLQYKVITNGGGKIPGPEDTVLINFSGTLIDGTEFASSSQRDKPSELRINRTIKGLSEALQLMPTGSKWELYLHPKLAYGSRSPGKNVPANSGLIYELELLSVK